jgi:hypothetical protein
LILDNQRMAMVEDVNDRSSVWHRIRVEKSFAERRGTNPIFSIIQLDGDTGLLEYRRVPSRSKRCRLCGESV